MIKRHRLISFALFLLFSTLFFASVWSNDGGNLAAQQNEEGTATATTLAGLDNLVCTAPGSAVMPPCHLNVLLDRQPAQKLEAISDAPCIDGLAAGTYLCDNVDLLALMPLQDLGSSSGSDLWGWTDPLTHKEYALMGLANGVAFIDISDPKNPVRLGNLPTRGSGSIWRDLKVYANHAFIVADYAGSHGMQVFDLTQLRNVTSPPITFTETAHYDQFGSAHNIVINEESGYAYAVGISAGTTDCNAGLHMIDIHDPTNPTFAGCFGNDGYTHDAQCVIYHGPDASHQGREICFSANVDALTLVDVTDKERPQQLSSKGYDGASYTHQGWLTADHRYFLLDDEGDELYTSATNMRTYIWDVADLDNPQLIGTHSAKVTSIDHNLYIHNYHVYQANYRSGLRILDLNEVASGKLEEVAYFDIYPRDDNPQFNGAWSNYPFFESGVVIVSGIEQGLFILEPTFEPQSLAAVTLSGDSSRVGIPGQTITHTLTITNSGSFSDSYAVQATAYRWATEMEKSQVGPLGAGESETIEIYVTVGSGAADSAMLTVTSELDQEVVATAVMHTSTRQTFLPTLMKP